MAQGIGSGNNLFITPFTFIATAEVISLLGAIPVFVDIDPQTFNIDPVKLKLAVRAVKEQNPDLYPLPQNLFPAAIPKAIIPVDLFGLAAYFDRINDIVRRENLFILEDIAQGFGGIYQGKKDGSLGDDGAVTFFQPNRSAVMVTVAPFLLMTKIWPGKFIRFAFMARGLDEYENLRIGLNGRLDTL